MSDLTNKSKGRKKQVKQTAARTRKQIDMSERRWLVLELRKQGGSYRQIAEQLREQFAETGEHGVTESYSHVLAFQDFKDVLEELKAQSVEEMEEQRLLDLERLDAILAGHFDAAQSGDPVATDRVMAILKARADWFGYNAPAKIDHTSSDGSMTPTAVQIIPYVSPDSDPA